MALNDKTISPQAAPDEALAGDIRSHLSPEGRLPCASAMALARNRGVEPAAVGRTADILGIHLTACQIGLFGYPGHAKGWAKAGIVDRPAPEAFLAELRKSAGTSNRVSCLDIWNAASRFGLARMEAGYFVDRAGFKIVGCQLGAF